MLYMKFQFFKYGFEFVSYRIVVIYGRGEMNVRFRYLVYKFVVVFNFIVQFESGEEEYKGIKLNRYGM